MTTSTPISSASASAPSSQPAAPANAVAKGTRKVAAKPTTPAAAAKAKVPRAKSVVRPAKPTAPSPAPAASKDTKAKKPKLVRDSFTIPKDEYAAIETLKQRCAAFAQPVKKSELLRAGLKALTAMPDAALRSAVQAVPSIKTGRPKAEQAAPAPTPSPSSVSKKPAKASRK